MRCLFILIVLVVTLSVASAQIRWDQLEKVADTDSAAPELKKWQQRVEAEYRQGGMIVPRFSSAFELPFESLKILFPQHRFFAISWLETPAPGKEKIALGLSSPEVTLVCDTAGKIVKEVNHTGNYEAFGELLNATKVVLRTNEDAKLVWNAFCDIHQHHWREQPAIKIDDRTWHLGDVTIDRFHYYYEVLLDAELRVKTAKLQADEIKKP